MFRISTVIEMMERRTTKETIRNIEIERIVRMKKTKRITKEKAWEVIHTLTGYITNFVL